MNDILVTRDSKDKIRVIKISCTWNQVLQSYLIERKTSQLNGKEIDQPIIEINKGKVKRTILEQAELQYKSEVKKYLDKGYRNILDFGITDIKNFQEETFPKSRVDQNNALKPMLCKKYDEVKPEVFNQKHYLSAKLDGVRMMLRCKEGVLKTSSRGGGDYDIPAEHILKNPLINQLFSIFPNLILDGELYKHGWNLQKISGLSRKIEREPEHNQLEYWVYDVADLDKTFEERLVVLKKINDILQNNTPIKIVNHYEVNSYDEIMKNHDKLVEIGYEGCVIRNPSMKYFPGKKDLRMIKVKSFQDAEYEILGIKEGLRDEDFVFIMKCDAGEFGAKPIGTREQRQWYRDNIKNLIGKLGTVKYFNLTPDSIPNLPIFKGVRDLMDL